MMSGRRHASGELSEKAFSADGRIVRYETERQCQEAIDNVITAVEAAEGASVEIITRCEQREN